MEFHYKWNHILGFIQIRYSSYYFLFVKRLNRVGNSNIDSTKNVEKAHRILSIPFLLIMPTKLYGRIAIERMKNGVNLCAPCSIDPWCTLGQVRAFQTPAPGKRANACRLPDSIWWAGFYGVSRCSWVLFNAAVQVIF